MSVNLHEIPTTDLFFHTVKIDDKRYIVPLYLNPSDCKARLNMLNHYKYARPNEKDAITIEEINNNISKEELSKEKAHKKEEIKTTEIKNKVSPAELNRIIKERTIFVDKMVNLINNIDSSIRKGLILELSTYVNSKDISPINKDFVKSIIFKLTQEKIIKNNDLNTYDIVYIYQLKYIFAAIQILALAKEERQPAIKALSSANTISLSEKTQKFFDTLDSYRIKEEEERIRLSKESKEENAETEEDTIDENTETEKESNEETENVFPMPKKQKDSQAEKLEEFRNELAISRYHSNTTTDLAYEELKKKDIENSSSKPTSKIEKAFDPSNSNESNIDVVAINLPTTCSYEINMNSNLVSNPHKINIIRVVKIGENEYKKNNELNLYNLDLITSFVEFIINDKLNQNTFTYTIKKDTDTKVVKTLFALSKIICKSEEIDYEVVRNESFDFVYNWE